MKKLKPKDCEHCFCGESKVKGKAHETCCLCPARRVKPAEVAKPGNFDLANWLRQQRQTTPTSPWRDPYRDVYATGTPPLIGTVICGDPFGPGMLNLIH